MGTYHTFFVATDLELDRLFPGWKQPHPEKVEMERAHPFTQQKVRLRDWLPMESPGPFGPPSLYDDVWGPPVAPIVEVENEYMQTIESSGAPGLRVLPHFRAKNCDPFYTFDALSAALVGPAVAAPAARMGADSDDDVPVVWALPQAATNALAATTDDTLARILDTVMAADPSLAEELGDERRTYFVEQVLRPLKLLAAEASRCRSRLCHYFALHH